MPLQRFTPIEDETASRFTPINEQPSSNELSWGDVGLKAVQNIPKSGVEAAGNIYQAIRHPIDTASNIGKLAAGLIDRGATKLESAVPESVRNIVNSIPGGSATNAPGWKESRAQVDSVGAFFADRYGGMENLKKTMAEDPVGFLADASTVLTGSSAIVFFRFSIPPYRSAKKEIGRDTSELQSL